MQTDYSKERIDALLSLYGLSDAFDCTGLSFHICLYCEGEIIASPNEQQKDLLFLWKKQVLLYALMEDGSRLLVEAPRSRVPVLGDFEFASSIPSRFFASAKEKTAVLCLPVRENRDLLLNNPRFLYFLLQEVVKKAEMGRSPHRLSSCPLKKRVIFLMEQTPDHTLPGLEAAASALGCSRRHLLRILKELTQTGCITKTARGCYILVQSKDV